MKCSMCDKEILNTRFKIKYRIEMERKSSDNKWENLSNNEIFKTLCSDCFDYVTKVIKI